MMAVMRVHKTKNYTIMSNHHFKNRELSLKAKGLLSLMLSLPDDWDYSIAGLVSICKENESAVKSGLAELKKHGYLTVTKLMPNETESGRIEYAYDIYEEPIQDPKKQGVENLALENQAVENPPQLNTKESSTYESNTKESKIKDKKDKQDKKATPQSDGFDEEFFPKPNWATKQLIKARYIKGDDLYVKEYNEIMQSITEENGFEVARDVLQYFLMRFKQNKGKDEHGNKIGSRLAYFETSVLDGVRKRKYETEDKLKSLWG